MTLQKRLTLKGFHTLPGSPGKAAKVLFFYLLHLKVQRGRGNLTVKKWVKISYIFADIFEIFGFFSSSKKILLYHEKS